MGREFKYKYGFPTTRNEPVVMSRVPLSAVSVEKRMTDNEYDAIPVAEVETQVEEWTAHHDPLARADLNRVESRFMRSVGAPARMTTEDGGMTEKNPHMRVASAEEFGVFAYEEDVVLIELDETAECAEMVGYPVDENRWAPVMICLAGPVEEARERIKMALVTLNRLADGELAL